MLQWSSRQILTGEVDAIAKSDNELQYHLLALLWGVRLLD